METGLYSEMLTNNLWNYLTHSLDKYVTKAVKVVLINSLNMYSK